MSKTRKREFCKILLIGLFTVTAFAFSTIVSNMIFTNLYSSSKSDMEFKGLVKLGDTYDQEKGIYSFFEKSDSLNILKKVYHTLSYESSFKYYEIMDNYIEYNGNDNISQQFLAGEDSSNVESRESSGTPLLSLQLSESVMKEFNLEACISDGSCFNKDDFKNQKENKVPVVLGYKYRDHYKIGDVFEFNYLGSLGFKGKVIGFFKSGTELYKDEIYYNLDKYVVIPAFNECVLQDEIFHKILYSLKCSCYFEYQNEKQLKELLKKIDSIRKEVGYHIDFCILNPDNQSATQLRKDGDILQNTNGICGLILGIVMAILLILIIGLDRKCFCMLIDEKEIKSRVFLLKLYTKRVIDFGIEIIVCYLGVSCLYGIAFLRKEERYIIQCSKCISFLLFCFLFSAYISALKSSFRKNVRKYELNMRELL